jgi:hypothetical protein
VARGSRARPHVADEHAELLRCKGEEHERAHLERLRAEGRAVEWPRKARSNRQRGRSVYSGRGRDEREPVKQPASRSASRRSGAPSP